MDGRNPDPKPFKIAILWRGDTEARRAATPHNNRFYRIFEELADLGIKAEPAVYDEAFADEVREQLLSADGGLCGSIRSIKERPERHLTPCCATSPHAALGSVRTRT